MAQDAELKLKVSLDLGFFRQQLAGLGQAAAGYNIPIQVKFDRRSVQNELNALSSNIRRRSYFLEVKTNLKSEIDNAATLAKALAELERLGQKTKGAASRAVTGTGAGTSAVDAAKFQSMVNRATKPALESLYAQMAKAKIPMGDVGKGTVTELRAAIMSGVPRITQDIAQGLANGLDPKLKENGSKGAKLFIDAFKDASGIASPSKVFKQIGEFSADGLEIGFINGLKDFKNKAVAEIKKIAALMKLELASVGDVRIGAGIGAIRAGVRGGTQYGAPIGPLQTGSREPWGRGTRGMYGGGGFEPYMAGAGRQLPAAFTRIPGISPTTSTANMLGVGLPALPAAGMSSAAGMRQAELFAREAAARARSAERGLAVMQENAIASRVSGQVPLGGGGPFLPPGGPPSGPTGGGGGLGGFGQFGRAMGGVSLPGAGTVRELGSEFAFAAKQVLLFGTAYKALAFIQTFPGQVGQAVGQLQSFRNTLNTISPSAEEAAASNKLILDLVDKYNVPLQSARDGFTKLYASMAPAGFAGNEIRDLFTGISKAAATFGMSADKVDRVNYAFAQMASKGQVMSEELKGQLGDVLPGAMAIFAKAAGFEGPEAIQKFSAALEAGAYKGNAMRVLLKNVGIEMNKEFGPGAEGAAKTFQGLMNRMSNSMQLLYESFEPVAIGFLNSVVVPLTSGIKQISDGFNAFFTGTAAKTAGGFAFAQELEKLRPTFEGIRSNLAGLIPQLTQFGQIALNVAKTFLQIAGNPIVGYLAKLYLVALPLNILFNGLTGIIGRVVMSMTTLNVGLLAGSQRFMTYRLAMQAFGVSAAQVSTTIRTFAPALNLATIGLRAIAAPAVLFGISLLVERFMMLQGAIDGVVQSTKGMLGNISGLANAGAIKELKNVGKDVQKQIATFESLRPFVGGADGKGFPQQRLTKAGASKMQELGLGSFVGTDVTGAPYVNDFVNASKIIEARLNGLRKIASNVQQKMPLALAISQDIAQQTQPQPSAMPEGATEETSKRESQVPQLRLQLEYQRALLPLEAAINNARLGGNNLLAARLEGEKELLDLKYEAEQVKVDNIPEAEKQLKIQAILAKAEGARMKARFNMEQEITKALQEQQDKVKEMQDQSALELRNTQQYAELVLNGVKPAHAKIVIEVENEISKRKEALELLREQIKGEINLLKVKKAQQKKLSPLEEQSLTGLEQRYGETGGAINALPGIATDITAQKLAAAAPKPQALLLTEEYDKVKEELEKLTSLSTLVTESAKGIGEAFGNSFKEIANGSMTAQEALASFFQNVGDYFLDMAARMIAKWMEMEAIGLVKNLLSGLSGGGGGASIVQGVDVPIAEMPPGMQFANGGIAKGGFVPFRAFAEGGMVAGPTLGLVGEGKYNEAIIPMPNGKSVPVDLQGAAPGNQIVSNITVNVSNGKAQTEGGAAGGNDLSRKLEGAVKQVIIGELRPGGVLAGRR